MAETKKRRLSPEIRRAEILRAAAQSFRTHGLRGSTVDDIAFTAGVSVGLLYRFFASKTEIIQAIIAEDIEKQLAQTATLLAGAAQDPELLVRRLSSHLAEDQIDREHFALQLEISAEVCRSPELRAFMREKRLELIDALAKTLPEWGESTSAIKHILESLDLAGAAVSGLAIHAAIYSDLSHMRDELVPAVIRTIFTRKENGPK